MSLFNSRAPRALSAFAALSVLSAFFFAACNVSDPEEHNEEELITTVLIVYTDTATGLSDTAAFRDADGPGGAAPTDHDTLVLRPDRTYRASLLLLDESHDGETGDITAEVREEGDDHQVFYVVSDAALTVAYDDEDGNGLPLGLETLQTTGAASTGDLTVILKHQPGIKNASSTVETGDTDVEITFVTRIVAAGT